MTSSSVRLLADWVLLRKLPAPTRTQGGIVIPETVEAPLHASVRAAGPTAGVPAGAKVLYEPNAGTEMTFEDTPCLLLRTPFLVALLED